MQTRNAVKWIAAILIATAAADSSALANAVHIYSGDFDLSIPALDDPHHEYAKGWMDNAIINVTEHIPICDIDVTVAVTHGSFFDLEIFLQSPAGTSVTLNFAGNLTFITRDADNRLTVIGGSAQFIFDDQAQPSIEQAKVPFTDPYRPAESLAVFENEDAYGPWLLRIQDAFDAHSGTLESVELIITTPEPATAILLALGMALTTLFRPRQNNP